MKTKKIGIIILALTVIGGVTGGVGYKAYLQEGKKQELEIQHMPEIKSNNEQSEVKSKDKQSEVKSNNEQSEVKSKNEQSEVKSKDKQSEVKSNNKQAKVKSKDKQSEVKSNNEQAKVKEDKLIHSNFEYKVQSYVAAFRKSGDDIIALNENLDSINTKDLNTEDKEKLDNLQLAAKDWSMLTGVYDYVIQAGETDSYLEKSMKYAKEALDQVNTNNLVDTGVMSKATVDKYTSFLREYIKKKQKELDK